MRAHCLLTLVALAAGAAAGACKETTKPARVASVQVAGSTGTLLVGDTARLTATPRDDRNKVLEGRNASWSSSEPAVATVNGGLVQGVSGGNATITASVGGVSGSLAIAVNNPGPTISSVSPDTVVAGRGAFELSVTGSGFVSGSVVVWHGEDRPTQYGDATTLRASITAADVDTAGTFRVTVRNPPPGGGASAAVTLPVLRPNPLPRLDAISPNSSKVGGPAFTLSVVGAKFVAGAAIRWNGQALRTTYHDAAYLTADVPASVLSAAGPVAITVSNPTPGGGASDPRAFSLPCVIPGPTLAAGQSRARLGAYFFDGWTGPLRGDGHFVGLPFGPFQEREPLSGWQDATSCAIEQQLAWARNMGIDFFVFDWFHDPMAVAGENLNSALEIMKSLPDRLGMQFAIMYTNHDTWGIAPADWAAAIDQWVGYMTDPGYVRVNGKPLFVVFDIGPMHEAFGSSAAVAGAFDDLRAAAQARGLPGVYIVGDIPAGHDPGGQHSYFPDLAAAAADGYDAFSLYSYWITLTGSQPFSILADAQQWVWAQAAVHSPKPFIAAPLVGHDARDQGEDNDWVRLWFSRSPQEVATLVSDAISWADANPHLRPEPSPAPPLVLIATWNEFGGGYLIPTVGEGTSYGDALGAMLLRSSGTPVPPVVASVSVTAAGGATTVYVGQTLQCMASARDAAGNVLGGRTITWSSDRPSVATVSGNGLVTGVAAGRATITATSEGVSGSLWLTIAAPVATVSVTGPPGIMEGETASLEAVLKDAGGEVLSGRVVSWSSSDPSGARVAGSVVTGVAAGSVVVMATSEGKSGTAAVKVLVPDVPVSPNANATATSVLRYLGHLKDRPDNRVVSGQYIASTATDTAAWGMFYGSVRNATGLDVGVVGLDIEDYWCAQGGTESHCVGKNTGINFDPSWMGKLLQHWQKGGLVTLQWSAHNPWTGGTVNDVSETGGNALDQLITPGSPVYDRWMARLDSVAAGLRSLQDAGVVVLWSPLHDANVQSAWWGIQNSPASYKRLWQHMFDYFTRTKGLTNLLWVYSPTDWPNAGVVYQYPGAAYVDIVGFSYYPRTASWTGLDSYSALQAARKFLAITEYGYSGPDPQGDDLTVINSIQSRMPLVSYILFWHDFSDRPYSIAGNLNASPFMHHSWILDLSELRAH